MLAAFVCNFSSLFMCVCVRVPVYMCDDFQLTYRVSLYLEKLILYLLDLSSMALTCPLGTDGSIRFDIWGREGSGFSSSSASVLLLVITAMSISVCFESGAIRTVLYAYVCICINRAMSLCCSCVSAKTQ